MPVPVVWLKIRIAGGAQSQRRAAAPPESAESHASGIPLSPSIGAEPHTHPSKHLLDMGAFREQCANDTGFSSGNYRCETAITRRKREDRADFAANRGKAPLPKVILPAVGRQQASNSYRCHLDAD
ncbi:hypothetical protein DdX_22222 [Ditylenchus destructor]|uniref:Uncharacterized protein n=1 Tax=Ditylenchus destructor TaxID=166010 RepID=A0AAD4QUL6_9BILA|nr:hypothetical protein DdX_22222 [Ditylenchus destructor]